MRLADGHIIARPHERDGTRHHRFHVELRSQAAGDATLLRCISPVGMIDLNEAENIDLLYEQQKEHGGAKVCIHPNARYRTDHVTIESGIPFRADSTTLGQVRTLVERTVTTADAMEAEMLKGDSDDPYWDAEAEADE